MIRPGPSRIEPGQCPGGYVIHVYAAPTGDLLWSGPVAPRMSAIAAAADEAARAAADHPATVHVAYDGDDGHRASLLEWAMALIDADG